MCGIAGIYERSGREATRESLLQMAGELAHRGPDGTGLYTDGRCGLVNTRLSIVDLSGGDQPIGNEDGRYWVVQNGEIYNHPELREELEGLGHTFTTHCDTEVIVHAYEQWGADCLRHFNGAFALAIWDREKQELFLARDRLGIRPLFVAEVDGALVFGSEGKALLRDERLSRGIDPLGLVETFSTWATSPDRSALAGIRELAPGSYLIWGREGPRCEVQWWDLAFSGAKGERTENEDTLAAELLALLEDSTRLRLRADVPVGAYLSGGLDSSATAALVKRMNDRELRAFAVRFTDPRFDERVHQDTMAQALGVRVDSVEIDGPQIAELFPEVVRLAEKPMFRTAPAPLLRLSRLVRDGGFKVVLTGEGADEIFAGYNIFREDKVRRFWARQPESAMRPLLLQRLYPYLAQDLGRTGGFARAFFGKHLNETDHPLYSHLLRYDNGARTLKLLAPTVLEQARQVGDPLERLVARLPKGYEDFGPLGRAQYLEIRTFLQGYLLHSQGDRMLMGHSVEGRFPFLDHRLAEFAARLPDRIRLRALEEKYLLRKAVKPLLPTTIARRSKQPYRAPILRAFLSGTSRDLFLPLLQTDSLVAAGLFDPNMVGRLLAKCERNLERGVNETDEMALVGVISAMSLHQQFVASPHLAAPRVPTREVRGAAVLSGT